VAVNLTLILEAHLPPLSLTPTLYHSFHEEIHLATCADINLREIMKGYFNVAYLKYEQGVIEKVRKEAAGDEVMHDGSEEFNFFEIDEFNIEVDSGEVIAVRTVSQMIKELKWDE
jgi:hypothetical protein